MGKYLTYEFVYSYFKSQNCELLENTYVNSVAKMKYKCSCGNISHITWNNFSKGKRCSICGKNKKYTFKKVEALFKEQSFELLENIYVNVNTKMKYRCSCGNVDYMTLSNLKKGRKCRKCNKRKKYRLREVKEYFKSKDCELLEEKYINTITKMKYRCSCGNISYITFNNFKNGNKCILCSRKRIGEKQKLLYREVYNYFKSQKCELLENEYINNHTKMKYRCSCGNISYTIWSNFKKGKRCSKCGKIKSIKSARKNQEKLGNWIPLKKLNDWSLYKRNVHNLTKKNYRKYKKIINSKNLPRGRGEYHLDHKFSVYEGFKNNIAPYIIANVNNLQMLSEFNNGSKGANCSITLKELYSSIENKKL